MSAITKHSRGRTMAGLALVVLGLAVVLTELAKYWAYDHPIHPTPVIVGGVIALFGAYVLDPKTTKGGGTLITDLAERSARVVALAYTGRRAGDVIAIKSDGTAEAVAVKPLLERTHPLVPDIDMPPPNDRTDSGDKR